MADSIKFEDNSFIVKAMMDKIALNWLDEAGGELVSQVKRASTVGRVAGGQTKNAWDYKVNRVKQEVTIGNPLENALWEEFGTGEHALKGNGRKGGWFVMIGEGANNISPLVVKAYGMKIHYGKDGKEFIFTRGKKPKRTFDKEYKKIKKSLIRSLEVKMKGMK